MTTQDSPSFEDLELLAEVSGLLTLVDLDSVMQSVIDLVARACQASHTSLFLHEQRSVDWEHIITMRDLPPDKSVTVVTEVLAHGFAGWVFTHKQGDIINDTETDERWLVFDDDPIETRSAMCVPFIHDQEVVAVITLSHEEPHHFRQYHLRLVTIIANQATSAIRNAQLFKNLNEQRRRLRTVLQSISDVMIVLDQDGIIEMVNEAAVHLLDVQRADEAVGQLLRSFASVDDVLSPILEITGAELTENRRWVFETRSERQQIDYRVTMDVWEDDEQRRSGFVVVMHNITELHDLARFKDEMLRVASHDLRSPLALIAGYTDMIGMDTPQEVAGIHEYVQIIKQTVERMSGLVDDLLRIERIRSSPLELHEQTDMAALVKVVLVNLRPSAVANHITFESEVALDGIPRIVADPVLLRQAMENLISNAIKYTPEQGTVTVRASYQDQQFMFSVQDTGIGIAEEHLPYLFESFYRVTDRRNKQKGSGLGLSLVKNVVARHGGEVWVQSEIDVGSVFGFWLPTDQPPTDEGMPPIGTR